MKRIKSNYKLNKVSVYHFNNTKSEELLPDIDKLVLNEEPFLDTKDKNKQYIKDLYELKNTIKSKNGFYIYVLNYDNYKVKIMFRNKTKLIEYYHLKNNLDDMYFEYYGHKYLYFDNKKKNKI